jgi:hypothetical protein
VDNGGSKHKAFIYLYVIVVLLRSWQLNIGPANFDSVLV